MAAMSRGSVALLCAVLLMCGTAWANPTQCVKDHFAPNDLGPPVRHWDPNEVEQVLGEVLRTYHLQTKVTIIACDRVTNVRAYTADGSVPGVPRGDYIIYKDYWVNLVIGHDAHLAFALFAHELAHIVNEDTYREADGTFVREIERSADEFAACVLGRANGEWEAMEELLRKIRWHQDELYPNANESLDAASKAYEDCQQGRTDTRIGFHRNSIVVTPMQIFPSQVVDDSDALNEKIVNLLVRSIRGLQSTLDRSIDGEFEQVAIGVIADTIDIDPNMPDELLDAGSDMGALAIVTGEGDLVEGELILTSYFFPIRPNPQNGRPFHLATIVDALPIRDDVSAARMSARLNPEWSRRAVLSLAVEEIYNRGSDQAAIDRSEQLLLALRKQLTEDDHILVDVNALLNYIAKLRRAAT
ncbi:hypothetical protein [Devosia sp.]|uniref:hypothetical protein n=1 Tax=Devosia sp. TaxID=1871048 RepID=UPI001B1805FF|nr:hypothetical protein [Devosia sp.]MBO9588526.1 hypothetical protein [Devosia sp.]